MNVPRAIQILGELLDAYDQCEHGDYFYDNDQEVCEAIILAHGALSLSVRETPMTPARVFREYYSDDYCPVCRKQQKRSKRGKDTPWYCERCGQKLWWGDT